jgi:hypothetical protein
MSGGGYQELVVTRSWEDVLGGCKWREKLTKVAGGVGMPKRVKC